jgi:hypothetical protein
MLYVSLMNWVFVSSLTIVNIWVFYKLTTVIEKNNSQRFVENKMNDTEQLLRKLRVDDYNELRGLASSVTLALSGGSAADKELKAFRLKLETMCLSSLYSYTSAIGKSQIRAMCDDYDEFFKQSRPHEAVFDKVNRIIKTIEIIIFTSQLRDNRLSDMLKQQPNHFDSTLVSIDNYLTNLHL